MSKSNSPRPNTNEPLGMKVARGPAASKTAVKVTDNNKGWAIVANIPVPPAVESRNFKKPLGLTPALINGGIIPTTPNKKPKVDSTELSSTSTQTVLFSNQKNLGGNPTPQGLSFTRRTKKIPKFTKTTTLELDWYGAKLSLNCLNIVHQPANTDRGNQSWLMLEMPLDEKTGNPPWIPPVAELKEDGRMFVPEFKCEVNGITLRCQILNIELFDKVGKKYTVVFRVIE